MVRSFVKLFVVLILLVFPIFAFAEEPVRGQYLKAEGLDIVIELEISDPAPSLVIVMQALPLGIKVVKASPELKMFDPEDGMAKWLLPKVKTGKITLFMQLDRTVKSEEISGEIRCRNPADGAMVSIEILKP